MKNLKSRNQRKTAIHVIWMMTCMLIIAWGTPSHSHSSEEGVTQVEATQLIRQAAHATDAAWEEFHTAAIEGTLTSPLMQTTLEGQLHDIRALLMQARVAERSQKYQSVKNITQKIRHIAQNIIQKSQERKL